MEYSKAQLSFDVPLSTYVKWFDSGKGYGFVVTDGGEDAFLHASVLKNAGVMALGYDACLLCSLTRGRKGIEVAAVHDLLSPGLEPKSIDCTPTTIRIAGSIKWFRHDRRYGFVLADDGEKDVFVHWNCLYRLGLEDIEPGTRVMMTVKAVPKGREATEIEIVDREAGHCPAYFPPYEDVMN